jgi:hypothetical protein
VNVAACPDARDGRLQVLVDDYESAVGFDAGVFKAEVFAVCAAATGDEDLDHMAIYEFGLGRERVLAPEARETVAERWYRGSHGPSATSAVASAEPCSTCAFWVPISGSFRVLFGACANEWSPSDGRVVSVDHGCGAHSQTEAERRLSEWPGVDPVVDSGAIDSLDLVSDPETEPETEPEPQPAPQPEAYDDVEVTDDVESETATTADDVDDLVTDGDVSDGDVSDGDYSDQGIADDEVAAE